MVSLARAHNRRLGRLGTRLDRLRDESGRQRSCAQNRTHAQQRSDALLAVSSTSSSSLSHHWKNGLVRSTGSPRRGWRKSSKPDDSAADTTAADMSTREGVIEEREREKGPRQLEREQEKHATAARTGERTEILSERTPSARRCGGWSLLSLGARLLSHDEDRRSLACVLERRGRGAPG